MDKMNKWVVFKNSPGPYWVAFNARLSIFEHFFTWKQAYTYVCREIKNRKASSRRVM